MDVLELSRWQFGITTVYHFIFVPLTIGLAPLVAIMQTMWHKTGADHWYKLTKFFGKLLLINFALGVVTGIVQEFQFGMNWSEYSRFVGDIFGAPLAIEALAAFFIESTFLGLWIFGWDKLPKRVHLACIWLVATATTLSALFILAANSWMQHPVGAEFNLETGRAEMVNFAEVLTNNTLWAAFPHVVTAALLTAGTFVAGIAAWWMVRLARQGERDQARRVFGPALKLGTVTMIIAGLGVIWSGDYQAKLMFEQQPMKMAAAEGLCETEDGAGFSILTIGDLNNNCDGVQHIITLPGFTSFLATGNFDSTIQGVEELQAEYEERFGFTDPETGEPIDYSPNLAVTYWSFRLMIGFAAGSVALAGAAIWLTRKGRVADQKWFARLGLIAIPMPFLASSFGWIFTEMGRQPWVVHPNPTGVDHVWMLTARGVSQNVSAGTVLTSMIVFTVVYGILGMVWYKLIARYARAGIVGEHIGTSASPPDSDGSSGGSSTGDNGDGDDSSDSEDSRPLSFAY